MRRTRSPGRHRQRRKAEEDPAALPGAANPAIRLREMKVAFYGRTAHAAGTCDSQAERHRQLTACRAILAAYGSQVTTEYFDEDCRADDPWSRRPQGQALLAALPGPAGSAWTLVTADIWRLFPRRTPAGRTGILQQLAQRHVLLVLADTGAAARTTAEYALLGRLMSGIAGSVPVTGLAAARSRPVPSAAPPAARRFGGESG